MNVRCPTVINPGQYFQCVVDVPKGSGLSVEVRMKDDVDGSMPPVVFGPEEFPGLININKTIHICLIRSILSI